MSIVRGHEATDAPTTVVDKQKVAIITGGSRGLGRSTAMSLAADGVAIVITYHTNASDAAAVVASITDLGQTAIALQLDVGDVASFAAFVDTTRVQLQERWGRDTFDFLVNNAGVALPSSFTETSESTFDQLVNVHFKGVYFLTQNLLPLLADGGRIVNLSTGLTRFTGSGAAVYASAKGAIEVLTRYLAQELGPRGITVNVVAPGAVATDFGGGQLRHDQKVQQYIASMTALGRYAVADDIGPAIAALLGDDNRWISGQRIEVSGGFRL